MSLAWIVPILEPSATPESNEYLELNQLSFEHWLLQAAS